jgi:6-phosphogluconolactonase/glucosamine-6-phosphate isomerase/deaminase
MMRRKSIFPLIAIIICIASNTKLYQKYQSAFTFQESQSERQFLDFSRATEATMDDKINIRPSVVHENITTEQNNQSNNNRSENENNDILFGNESNINKTAAVVNDVPSGKDVITLFDRKSKYQNCWLSSDVNLLGCGVDGHAFLVTMNCPHPVTNTNINRYDMVLKIRTKWHIFNDTEEEKQRIYISERDSSLESLAELHHLVMDNTTARIRQYFALPIGTATFQKDLLLKEVYTKKKSPTDCMNVIPKSSTTRTNTTSNTIDTFTTNDETVLGTIMEYGGRKHLRPEKLKDPKDRRRVVKDLVCMYHHMYRVSENE